MSLKIGRGKNSIMGGHGDRKETHLSGILSVISLKRSHMFMRDLLTDMFL